MKVFTAEQMRAFDRAATEEYGIPSIVLMENAALRVIEFLEIKFAPLAGKRIAILCGKGNNGGDGLAIARHLTECCFVSVFLTCSPDELKGDALTNFRVLRHAHTHGEAFLTISEIDPSAGSEQFGEHDLLLDALLGTGFRGSVENESLRRALHYLDVEFTMPRVAIDLPSGLNADTGEAASAAAQADYTVTFAAPKRGLFLRDGLDLCGEIWVGSIGTASEQLPDTDTGAECITRERASSLLPHRPLDAHKGDAGRVVVCGGSFGMSGAPALASRAALRVGAGLCGACLPEKIIPLFASALSEATSHPLLCDDEGRLLEAAADAMPDKWKGANVVALGPGLSRSDGALDFARRVVAECPLPIVVDADALYSLRAVEAEVKAREAPTILTPHPGEMGELMQMKADEVNNDRLGVALACAQKFNAIVVLKGARSVVALPDGRTFFNLTGNAGMATGGSGDVLTGAIAGLLAQLKDAEAATLLGVYLHGLAGDLAFAEKGNGLIAGDIAEALPRALLKLQEPAQPQPNSRLRKLE